MNSVNLIGRLTKDPEVRYGAESQTAVGRFTIAINRMKDKNGNEQVDYPTCVCFGKVAENLEKYVGKGDMVGVVGELHTGAYEKDGKKVYFTEVSCSKVEFLDTTSKKKEEPKKEENAQVGFTQINDDDIPF